MSAFHMLANGRRIVLLGDRCIDADQFGVEGKKRRRRSGRVRRRQSEFHLDFDDLQIKHDLQVAAEEARRKANKHAWPTRMDGWNKNVQQVHRSLRLRVSRKIRENERSYGFA
jgi:hypothetical protein